MKNGNDDHVCEAVLKVIYNGNGTQDFDVYVPCLAVSYKDWGGYLAEIARILVRDHEESVLSTEREDCDALAEIVESFNAAITARKSIEEKHQLTDLVNTLREHRVRSVSIDADGTVAWGVPVAPDVPTGWWPWEYEEKMRSQLVDH